MPRQLLRAMLVASIVVGRCAWATGTDAGCASTVYRLADGAIVDVAPSDEGHLRWRRADGTTGYLSRAANDTWTSARGWTGKDDGTVVDLARCHEGEIRFGEVTGHRLALDVTDVGFVSGDAHLAGRLLLPPGRGAVPIVVFVHGSEDSSALRFFAMQRLLPAQGVGVFVYDKRGTGASSGVFTHDLRQLAADARAALDAAKATAGARAGRVGYYGTSQGGWTAPLAATSSHPDFVIVGYGLAVSPLDEDREALALDMTRHGFGAAEIAKADEIGAAAQAIVRHRFSAGYGELRTVVDRYKAEPWFRFVRGNVTGIVLSTPEADLRRNGPRMFAGLDLDYDPMPVLRALGTPQLWILGGEDIDAPSLETRRRLLALRSTTRPISIVVYPDVEHGLYAFETVGDERLSTRQPASLQGLIVDFARGQRLDAGHDDAQVVR
jgi:pimeloyl-ACP methyl ester carboxylesterase